jgi:hypothetical protein
MKSKLTIGYLYGNYPEKRCIINKTNYVYKKYDLRHSVLYILNSIFQKMGGISYWDKQSAIKLPNSFCDVYHTFNQIPISKTPNVITFETSVPRNQFTIERRWEWDDAFHAQIDRRTQSQIEYIAQENCKCLIALSKSAYDIQNNMLKHLNVDSVVCNAIKEKTFVLHPPQKVLISQDEVINKFESFPEKLTFVFCGNDFFRKGGAFCIDILDEFAKDYKFELVVISSMNADSISGANSLDVDKYKIIINERDGDNEIFSHRAASYYARYIWIFCIRNAGMWLSCDNDLYKSFARN